MVENKFEQYFGEFLRFAIMFLVYGLPSGIVMFVILSVCWK